MFRAFFSLLGWKRCHLQGNCYELKIGDGHLLGNGRRPSGPRFPNESLRKEDLSSKIDLVIAWLSDLKTKIENLNFVAKGLERNVTCLEEEVA